MWLDIHWFHVYVLDTLADVQLKLLKVLKNTVLNWVLICPKCIKIILIQFHTLVTKSTCLSAIFEHDMFIFAGKAIFSVKRTIFINVRAIYKNRENENKFQCELSDKNSLAFRTINVCIQHLVSLLHFCDMACQKRIISCVEKPAYHSCGKQREMCISFRKERTKNGCFSYHSKLFSVYTG